MKKTGKLPNKCVGNRTAKLRNDNTKFPIYTGMVEGHIRKHWIESWTGSLCLRRFATMLGICVSSS